MLFFLPERKNDAASAPNSALLVEVYIRESRIKAMDDNKMLVLVWCSIYGADGWFAYDCSPNARQFWGGNRSTCVFVCFLESMQCMLMSRYCHVMASGGGREKFGSWGYPRLLCGLLVFIYGQTYPITSVSMRLNTPRTILDWYAHAKQHFFL